MVERVTMDMVVWTGQVTSVVRSQYCMVLYGGGVPGWYQTSDQPGVPRPLWPV